MSENEKYREVLLDTIPYVDILFGNDDEVKAFAKHALDLETTDLIEMCTFNLLFSIGKKFLIYIILKW